jgi:hypothetical protein
MVKCPLAGKNYTWWIRITDGGGNLPFPQSI